MSLCGCVGLQDVGCRGKIMLKLERAVIWGFITCWIIHGIGLHKDLWWSLMTRMTQGNNLVVSCSVTKSCPALCDPHGLQHARLPYHSLSPLEFAQTRVQWVSDAIQPSHPLLPPSPPALNLFQHQCLFQWVSSSHQVAKVLTLQLQHQSWFDLLVVHETCKSLLQH